MSATRSALSGAFRRLAMPLTWYYAVTLGLPLANGAAAAGAAFARHALVVLLLPPMLIAIIVAATDILRVAVDNIPQLFQNAGYAASTRGYRQSPSRKNC
jgi:hypothetical protein